MRRLLTIIPLAFGLIGAKSPSAAAGPEGMVDLGTIAVPIVDGGRVQGALEVRLALTSGSDLEPRAPLLRAAAREALSEYARLHASPMQAVDVALLASSVEQACRRSVPDLDRLLLLEARSRAS